MNRFTLIAAGLLLVIGQVPGALAALVTAAEVSLPADSRFTVEVEGSGPDVILIPGLSSPRAVWDGARAILGGKFRLHLVQLKGFGGSDAGPNIDGKILDTSVEQLATYIREHKLRAPAVVGHSMGGLMGLMLARRYPETVGKLLVVDALPFVGAIFMPDATVAALEPRAKMMRDMMAASYGKPADLAMLRMVGAQNALKPASQEQVAAWTAQADPRVSGQALYEDMVTDLRPEMAKITTPITLVYPWAAGRFPEAQAADLYRKNYAGVPKVAFRPIGDSGHFIMLDQPERFAEALREFLGA